MSRSSNKKVIRKQSTGRRIIEQSRFRLLSVSLFFVLCFISISVRIVDVAVIHGRPLGLMISVTNPENENEVDEVDLSLDDKFLERGDITDRNGVLLATSLMTGSIFVNPKKMQGREEAATKLSKTLGMDRNILLRRFKSNKTFVWIKRNLPPKEQKAVNSLGIPGLYFLPEEKRVYPYGRMMSHAVGFVGIDNKGLAGIEKGLDTRLRDKARNYDPVELSIDVRLQAIMHEEMSQAVKRFKAEGAMGGILDVKTGELLSLVSLPDYNPQQPGKASAKQRFNRATQGAYEVGSTFKTFTMAMALDAGTTSMSSSYNTVDKFRIAKYTISDDHPVKRWLSLPEIFAYSSNIGTARVALEYGGEKQQAFLRKLGMLDPIKMEIPERSKPLYPSTWRDINTVTISYGHGISISPMHLLRGISTMVNGGHLQRLTLLKDGNKGRVEGRRIIRNETSEHVRRLMRLVVNHGTGNKADVPGYRVGGKTGTAEKVNSTGYDKDAKIVSFVSVFPIDNPRYVVLVMVDEPQGNESTRNFATGGWVAAPVAGRIITRMGPLLGIKPIYNAGNDDADRFWVGKIKKRKPSAVQALEKRYIHAATY